MSSSLSRSASYLLPIGAVVVLSAALFFGLISPWVNWSERVETDYKTNLDRVSQLHESITYLNQQLSTSNSEAAFGDVLKASDMGLARAQIQASLGDLAVARNIRFRSISPINAPQIDQFESLAFRIESETDLASLRDFLASLEQAKPMILVETGSLRRLSRNSSDVLQPMVNVQLDVFAPIILEDEALP